MILDEQYWNDRYLNNEAQWDMGKASTPLATYFEQLTDKNIAILIPGGGNSYEAGYLLEHDFTNITVIDISEFVCDTLKKKYADHLNKELKIIHGDFFALKGSFDLIVEQTFFCALDPELRKDYVQQMKKLLRPNGKLMGLLFNKDFEVNPPFGGNEKEYRDLFENDFTIKTMLPCYNSIPPRAGGELFVQFINH
jgi:SAM-dependent methyltransferase